MKEYRRICADIDLDALTHNLDEIHRCIRKETKIIAVVKADGYGHGAVPLAEVMEKREDVWGYAVATPEEAEELYTNGIKKPILILGYTFPEYDAQIVQENLRPAVFSLIRAKQLSEEAMRQDKICKIHIKLDTGMSRLGFLCDPAHFLQSMEQISEAVALPGLACTGIFTHFANADGDEGYTMRQLTRFLDVVDKLRARGVEFKIRHCAASAAVLNYPCTHLDMVRPGIALYGHYPDPSCQGLDGPGLLPVMTLKTRVVAVRELPAGTCVSYGCTHTLKRDSRLAVLPVGYADGLEAAVQPGRNAGARPARAHSGPRVHGHVHGGCHRPARHPGGG